MPGLVVRTEASVAVQIAPEACLVASDMAGPSRDSAAVLVGLDP